MTPHSVSFCLYVSFIRQQGASDKLVGLVLLLTSIVVYVYYTTWVVLTVRKVRQKATLLVLDVDNVAVCVSCSFC